MKFIHKVFFIILFTNICLMATPITFNQVNAQNNSFDLTEYLLGPEDILSIYISIDKIIQYDITINQSGDLIIPILGQFYASNITLDQLKTNINQVFSSIYDNGEISISIKKVGDFYIDIFGLPSQPKKILVNGLETVYDLANNINYNKIKNISNRFITINRRDTLINVDILKFNSTQDNQNNPFLLRSDKVLFNKSKQSVRIQGEVLIPGEYEFLKGESVSDIIKFSGGLLSTANSNNLLWIHNQDSKNLTLENSKSVMVQSNDLIIVNSISKKNVPIVEIKGQVRFPGIYFLEHQLTVEDLIKKAGGYIEYADSVNIEINNKNLINVEMTQINAKELHDSHFYNEHENSYISARYRTKYGQNKSEKEFIEYMELIDGDIVTINRVLDFVEIIGGVNNPGKYPYYSNFKVNDYIKIANGLLPHSSKKVFLIKNNGTKIKVSKSSYVKSKDTIFIPENLEYNTWDRTKDILTILTQVGTLIVIINNIK